ncbi:MAG: hypothetical protein ACPGYY_05490, partial [Bacteroidia bacterium]
MKIIYSFIGIFLVVILFIVTRATIIGEIVNSGLTSKSLHYEKASRFKGTVFLHENFSYYSINIERTSLTRNTDSTYRIIPSSFKFGKWERNLRNGTILLTPNSVSDSIIEVQFADTVELDF